MTSAESSYDPWSLAKERYLEGLEPHEKTLFHEATLENLYYDTSNLERDDSNSKSRKIIQKLQPLVEKIEDYGKALDAYANIAPTYISPIWGSIRILIVVARAYGKFYDRIVETLGRIGDILPRFRDYERIFDREKHRRLTQAISNAYLDIIKLCSEFRRLLQGQKASALKRIWKPLSLDGEFDGAVKRFREHRKTVEREAETCHMIEAAEARALVEANRKLDEIERKAKIRAKLLAQLSSQDYEARHRALRKLRYEDTGGWVLQSTEYIGWLESGGSSLLSLYGIPGCGKSILVSAIYDALVEASAESVIVAYYCDYADKRTLEPINIFGSIAHGLLKNIEIPSSVQTLIEKAYCDGVRTPQLGEILAILKTTVETSFDSVTIVVDGLDEIKEDERQLVYHNLRDILSVNKVIKVLLSSRNDESQTAGLSGVHTYRIQMLPEKISTDISGYVCHAVHTLQAGRRLVLRDHALEMEILNALIDGAKGMFLWVKFQLEDLCTAETDAEVRAMLQNLPKDLSETYDRFLGRVMGRQREQLIRRMFEWILCSKRPLYIEEMQEAIAFTMDDKCWDASKIPNDMTRLVRACGNLVVIDEETLTLQFAHYTVEQYLLNRPVPIGSSKPFSLRETETAAAEMCLAYLSFADFETQLSTFKDNIRTNMSAIETLVMGDSLLPNQQLANTALRFWSSVRLQHGKPLSCTVNYDQHLPKLKPMNDSLLDKYKMLAYVIEFWLSHTSGLDYGLEETSQAYMLFYNLWSHKSLLSGVFPQNMIQTHLDDELQPFATMGWAIDNDHPLLLRLVSKTNFFLQMNEKARWMSTTAHYFNKEEVYQEREPTAECPNTLDDALFWLCEKCLNAARQGHLRVFSYMRPFFSHEFMGYALLEAARHGQLQTVKYLLPLAPKLGGGFPFKRNALEVAAFYGKPDIVRYIIEFGHPIFTFNDPGLGMAILVRGISQNDSQLVDGLRTVLLSKRLPQRLYTTLGVYISNEFRSALDSNNVVVARELFRQFYQSRPSCFNSFLPEVCERGQHEILEPLFPDGSLLLISEYDLRLAFQNIARFPNIQSVKKFLKYIEQIYAYPLSWVRLSQSALFAASCTENIEVVAMLLDYCRVQMPDPVKDDFENAHWPILAHWPNSAHWHISIYYDVENAGKPDCNNAAISQAAYLNDFTALRTLIKAAIRNSDVNYLEACIHATTYCCSKFVKLDDVKWLAIDTLSRNYSVAAKNMLHMLLDLEQPLPQESSSAQGDLLEALLLRLAGLCFADVHLVEALVSPKKSPQEIDEKYYCMTLCAAVECFTSQTVLAILSRYNFELSRFSQELKQSVLRRIDLVTLVVPMEEIHYRVEEKPLSRTGCKRVCITLG